MAASTRIGYRANPNDEKILLMLAENLERNISDTLRFSVRHTPWTMAFYLIKNLLLCKRLTKKRNIPNFSVSEPFTRGQLELTTKGGDWYAPTA